MNFNKNYYGILGIDKDSTPTDIKKAYYKLSFIHHPDKGGDDKIFSEITEAYDVLSDDIRDEYDSRSKFGRHYDEKKELLINDFNNLNVAYDNEKLEKTWNQNELNIIIRIGDNFDGKVEYERWVICKVCKGSGRDTKSKIQIKDEYGNILKLFDGSDGCDFCEGSGKDEYGYECFVCKGKGKVGWAECNNCKGERRILGKQRLEKIKFTEKSDSHRVDSMGHFDKYNIGMVGHLWLVKENKS